MVKDEINLAEYYIAEKGWELVEESKQTATEWYEFKMEDLYHANLDTNIGEGNPPSPTISAPST